MHTEYCFATSEVKYEMTYTVSKSCEVKLLENKLSYFCYACNREADSAQ